MPRTTQRVTRRLRPSRFLAALAAGGLAATVLIAGPVSAAGAIRPSGGHVRSVAAVDPTGDAARSGTLEPLLGPGDLYAASDITGVRAAVDASAYTLEVGVVDAFTGGSDLLVLTGEVVYDLTWRTVDRRRVVSEVPDRIRVAVSAAGVDVQEISLPPRCRNSPDLAVTLAEPPIAYAAADPVAGAVLSVVVPRACSKGTYGVVRGVGDVRVTSAGDAAGGSLLLGSYFDEARVDGVAVARKARRSR